MNEKNIISISLKNQMDDLNLLNRVLQQIQHRLSLSPKCFCQISLIVEELFTNILKYAFKDQRTHFIEIYILHDEDFLIIQMEDDGRAFNPAKVKEPDFTIPFEQRETGGLGIFFVHQLTDEISYQRKNGKNCTLIKKKIIRAEKKKTDSHEK